MRLEKVDPQKLAGILAVLALAAYATFRLDYYLFYDRFGLSPEDVGLGYSQGLVQTALISLSVAVAVVALALAAVLVLLSLNFLLGALYFALYVLAWRFFVWALSKALRRPRPADPQIIRSFQRTGSIQREAAVWILTNVRLRLAAVVMAAVAALFLLGLVSSLSSKRLAHRHTVGWMHAPLVLLGISAQRLRTQWKDPNEVEKRMLPQGACVVYLGSGNDRVFVHRFATRTDSGRTLPAATLRLPAGDILLTGQAC